MCNIYKVLFDNVWRCYLDVATGGGGHHFLKMFFFSSKNNKVKAFT